MVDLKTSDWSEIEKLIETFPQGCILEKVWSDGVESHVFSTTGPDLKEIKLEKISDIADYLGIKVRHFYRQKTDEVCEGLLFFVDKPRRMIGVIFNTNLMGHTKLVYGRISLALKTPFVVFDDKSEAERFKKKKEWEKLKEGLKIDQEFLKDPWKEYRAKKKKYEEKIIKAEGATRKKIEETKERVKELEKTISDLEAEFLSELGVKENREGN